MKFEWIEKRLNSIEIDNIESIPSDGKNILITPEGYGKSTKVIKHFDNNISEGLILYGAHTIDNALEKYEYLKNQLDNLFLIDSDSELFRKMVKAQSQSIYDLTKKCISKSANKYLSLEIYSINNDNKQIKRIKNTESQRKRLQSILEYNNQICNFNNEVLGDLYSYLHEVKCYNTNYYIIFKLVEDEDKYFSEDNDTDSIENILKYYNYDTDAVNTFLSDKNSEMICITSKAINNWKGFLKERDSQINKALSSKKSILIAQNKVIDNVIIPKIKRENLKNTYFILDELTYDCFKQYNEDNIHELISILNKAKDNGIDNLSKSDKFLIEFFKLKGKDLNSDIKLDELTISNQDNIEMFVGKPFLANRLTIFDNILILTTEKLTSSILHKSYGFNVLEIDKNYVFKDKKIRLFSTTYNTPITTVRSQKELINNYINKCKENSNSRNSHLVVGTLYFGTDTSLDAIKGRNLDELKKISIFKNPDPAKKFNILKNFISEFEGELNDEELRSLKIAYSIDQLNQVFGRVSGYRRTTHPKTVIDMFYFSKDSITSEALSYTRYMGTHIEEKNTTKYIISESTKYQKNLSIKNSLSTILDIVSDKELIEKNKIPSKIKFFNLDDYHKIKNLTYKQIVEKVNGSLIKLLINSSAILNKVDSNLYLSENTEEVNVLKLIKDLESPIFYKFDSNLIATMKRTVLDIVNVNNSLYSKDRKRTLMFIRFVLNVILNENVSDILKEKNLSYLLMLRTHFWYFAYSDSRHLHKNLLGDSSILLTTLHHIEYLMSLKKSMLIQSKDNKKPFTDSFSVIGYMNPHDKKSLKYYENRAIFNVLKKYRMKSMFKYFKETNSFGKDFDMVFSDIRNGNFISDKYMEIIYKYCQKYKHNFRFITNIKNVGYQFDGEVYRFDVQVAIANEVDPESQFSKTNKVKQSPIRLYYNYLRGLIDSNPICKVEETDTEQGYDYIFFSTKEQLDIANEIVSTKNICRKHIYKFVDYISYITDKIFSFSEINPLMMNDFSCGTLPQPTSS